MQYQLSRSSTPFQALPSCNNIYYSLDNPDLKYHKERDFRLSRIFINRNTHVICRNKYCSGSQDALLVLLKLLKLNKHIFDIHYNTRSDRVETCTLNQLNL